MAGPTTKNASVRGGPDANATRDAGKEFQTGRGPAL